MTQKFEVLIVGGGHGGAQAAMMLRRNKFEGTIAIVSDEADLPYERPPLSKTYLAGEKSLERLFFRPLEAWTERDVTMILGKRVASVDAGAHHVTTEDGDRIGYEKLIWAAGGAPRRLTCAGGDVAGIHTVRNRLDTDRMTTEMDDVRDVVVIGGGYIGLETAATLSKFGKNITVVEAQDRVLARVAGEPLSHFFEVEHKAHGVSLLLGTIVDCIDHSDGRATGVRLSNGTILPAQMVIVGIGIIPAVDPLIAAGADGTNGVRVDAACRTSIADVFAIGDCAEHRNGYADNDWIRLESVQNANDQAATVANAICGLDAEYDAVPWFWSNQYDLRLQTVGLSRGHDSLVLRGDPAERAFSVIYLRQGRVVALDCVNATRDYVQGRLLVEGGVRAEPARLADPDQSLKSLA